MAENQYTKVRRRGSELEAALLEAVVEEMHAVGYDGLTYDAVAARAGTSRPVLYRRWATKPELVRAAMEFAAARRKPNVPDTGSLRGDVVATLVHANLAHADVADSMMAHLSSFYRDSGTSPADLRASLIGVSLNVSDLIEARAIERGELQEGQLHERVRSLPFDLYRHELLMTLAPVPEKVIETIVDKLFMPLVEASADPSGDHGH